MQPIVNGFETEYQGAVEFRRINAEKGEGLELLQAYALFGHPSYLILNEHGEILWRSVGEQPEEDIRAAIEAALGP